MQLVGIQIHAGGRWKFIGKAGRCPSGAGVPSVLVGQCIFYRSVPWKDVYSTATKTLGVDMEAWEEAKRQGAKWLVMETYEEGRTNGKLDRNFKRNQKLYYIGKDAFDKTAYPHDLGEHVQLRLKPDSFFVKENASEIKMGHTNNVKQVRHVARETPITEQAPAPVPTAKEKKEADAALTGSLFG